MSVFSKFMTATAAGAALVSLVAPATPAFAIPMATRVATINNGLKGSSGDQRETPAETLQRIETKQPAQAMRIVQSGTAQLAVKNGLPESFSGYFLKCTTDMVPGQQATKADVAKSFDCFEKSRQHDTDNQLVLLGLGGIAMAGGIVGASYLQHRNHMRKLGY